MTDKYQQIRTDAEKMIVSYGNKAPISLYPGTIIELLDDLQEMADYNDHLKRALKSAEGRLAGLEEKNAGKKRRLQPTDAESGLQQEAVQLVPDEGGRVDQTKET